jgi:hypothetical protein
MEERARETSSKLTVPDGDECAAGAIDVGVVILALVVCYPRVFAFLYLLDPRNFTAPRPSPALVYAVGSVLRNTQALRFARRCPVWMGLKAGE